MLRSWMMALGLMGLWAIGPSWADLADIPDPLPAVYVEDSPAAAAALEQAEHLIQQQRPGEAAQLLQGIIDRYPRKLMPAPEQAPSGGRVYVEARDGVMRRLRSDPRLLEAYLGRVASEAALLLEEAQASDHPPQALREVVDRYALTPSGREAAMRLAAVWLRAGRASAAAGVLEELRAIGGVDPREAPRIEALSELAGQVHAATEGKPGVGEWSAPKRERLIDPGTRRAAVASPALLGEPLWSVALGRSVAAPRRFEGAKGPVIRPGPFPALPTLWGDRVLVNDGLAVQCVEVSSGREVWRYAMASSPGVTPTAMRFMPNPSEPRGFAGDAGRVWTVLGAASVWPPQVRRGSSEALLVCLDAATGELLWRLEAEQVDPSLRKGFFVGTPRVHEGVVIAAVRRSQVSGFQDSFIVGLDAATGQTRWRRHLCSASLDQTQQREAGQAVMSLRGGVLWVVDTLGATARIDPTTGSLRWLHVPEAPPGPGRTVVTAEAATLTEPILLPMGLLVVPAGGGMPRVLDPETGSHVLDAPMFAGSAFAVGDDGLGRAASVLVVDRGVHLIDAGSLNPVWSLSLASMRQPVDAPAVVLEGQAWVVTASALARIDLARGEVVQWLEVDQPGNLLPLEHQVLLAGHDELRSYLAWPQAYAQLSQRIRDNPTDPTAALSLAQLAMKEQRFEVVIEAVDAAARAPQGLFDRLLPLVLTSQTLPATVRAELFDRLATVTQSPADEARYHFHVAQFLTQEGRAAEAVSHYQTLLEEPELSAQLIDVSGGRRQAGMEARLRLLSIVERWGLSVYAPFHERAQSELMMIDAAAERDVGVWVRLAERYPVSPVAGEAYWAAAMLSEAAGDPRLASEWLRRALSGPIEASLAATIQSRLATLSPTASLPRLGDGPYTAHSVPGSVLWRGEPYLNARELLLRREGELVRWEMGQATPRWSVPLPGGEVVMLGRDAQGVVIWLPGSQTLLRVDLETGAMVWRHGTLDTMLALAGDVTQRQMNRPLAQRRFLDLIQNGPLPNPNLPQTVAAPMMMSAMESGTVLVCDDVGRLIGLDAVTGEVRYRQLLPMDALRQLHTDRGRVHLLGMTGVGTEASTSMVLTLDAATGEPLRTPLLSEEAVLAVRSAGDRRLMLIAPGRVTACDPVSGTVVWRRDLSGVTLSGEAVVGERALMVQGDTQRVLLDLSTGERLVASEQQPGEWGQPVALPPEPVGGWLFTSGSRVTLTDAVGAMRWRGVSVTASMRAVAAGMSADRVAIVNVAAEAAEAQGVPNEPGAAGYEVVLFDRETGQLRERLALKGLAGPLRGDGPLWVEGGLLLRGEGFTVVITPAPRETPTAVTDR